MSDKFEIEDQANSVMRLKSEFNNSRLLSRTKSILKKRTTILMQEKEEASRPETRQFSLDIIENKILDFCSVATVLAILALVVLKDHSHPSNADFALFIFNSLFYFDTLIKALAWGLFQRKGLFTRFTEILALLSTMYSTAAYLLELDLKLYSLKLLLLLRYFDKFPSEEVQLMFKAVKKSAKSLSGVLLFVLFFLLILSIIGNQIFIGKIYNRCRVSPFPCGERLCTIPPAEPFRLCNVNDDSCPEGLKCINFFDLSSNFPLEQVNRLSLEDEGLSNSLKARFGLASYDNIGLSMLNVISIMTLQNFHETYEIYSQTEVNFYTIFFFLYFTSFFGGVLVFKLVLATQNEALFNQKTKKKTKKGLNSSLSENE